jgi:hypothetical protein
MSPPNAAAGNKSYQDSLAGQGQLPFSFDAQIAGNERE